MSRITGVVDASGAGAGRSPGDELWTFVVTLAAWRVDDGPLRNEPLRVRKPVREEERAPLYQLIRANTLVALDAELIGKDAADIETAVMNAVLEAPSDPELDAALSALMEPVMIEDPVLGRLTLDRRFDWFVGEAIWMGAPFA